MSAAARSLGVRAAIGAAIALAAAAAIALATGPDGERPAARSTESWAALHPAILQRTEVGAARVRDRIYVVGGFISSGGTTGEAERYDISANRWRRIRSLPIAVNHPGVTAYNGRIYLLGGNLGVVDGRERKSKRLYRYNPRRNRWTRLPDAPSPRAALGLVAIGNRLYAAGGYDETDSRLRTLEVYDIDRRRWTTGPPMPTGRNHVGAAVLDGELVVTGGRPGDINGGMTTVERYDPKARRWSSLPPLGTARSGHAAVVTRGRLVVLGGEELVPGGQTIEQVEAFDPEARSWRALPDMVTPRHGLGGVARRGRIYSIEGGPQPGLAYSSAIEYLDLP
jgi:N-acetylneuraminic acid mutarotase